MLVCTVDLPQVSLQHRVRPWTQKQPWTAPVTSVTRICISVGLTIGRGSWASSSRTITRGAWQSQTWGRKSECKVNLLSEIPLAAMAAGEILRKEPLGIMDLCQLTVYEQFGWINMHAVTFSFVDRSSSRGLRKFGENIPTSPISPEVIDVYTLNFKPNFKFSRLIFFRGGDPRPNWGVR